MNNREQRDDKPRTNRRFDKTEKGTRSFQKDEKKVRSFSKNRTPSNRGFGKEERRSRDINKRGDREERNFNEDRKSRPFSKNTTSSNRSFGKEERRSRDINKRGDRAERNFNEDRKSRSFSKNTTSSNRSFGKEERRSRDINKRGDREERNFNEDRKSRSFSKNTTPSNRGFGKEERRSRDIRKRGDREERNFNKWDKEDRRRTPQFDPPKRKKRDVTAESAILTEIVERRKKEGRQTPRGQKIVSLAYEEQYGPIRLNKYIANSGICSRRDADTLIQTGAITVNGEIVTELGTKVMPTDEVRYGDKVLQREKPVYLLLNKPKDFITTLDDERDRKHVLQLVKGACKERIYPVGRLDKNTTGVLLFTNDGEMTKKLTHPKHGIRKIYHVELDRNLTLQDFNKIAEGIELQDGLIIPDELSYVGNSKKEIGITIHSGKNRIIRRIFESLNYQIIRLDRVVFAGLTKKDLPRGTWRFLTKEEINILKMSL